MIRFTFVNQDVNIYAFTDAVKRKQEILFCPNKLKNIDLCRGAIITVFR